MQCPKCGYEIDQQPGARRPLERDADAVMRQDRLDGEDAGPPPWKAAGMTRAEWNATL